MSSLSHLERLLRDPRVDLLLVGNQVTPFKLPTPDGETIYAWHILPLRLYARHEETVSSSRAPGLCDDVKKTEAFRLLKEDRDAKVIIYCRKAPTFT